MKGRQRRLAICVIVVLGLCTCNNFFHDLIPPDDNLIISFEIDGQIEAARIGPNTIDITVEKGTDLRAVIPRIFISKKASLLPITLSYVRAAFPSADLLRTAIQLHTTEDFTQYVSDLIRDNPDFNIPALTLPMDFTGPVSFLVVGGQGDVRQYTVNVETDTGEPRLLSFSFAKYDNPELMGDALCFINETDLTAIATAVYPAEIDTLSYKLVPIFEILGERLEIDGDEIIRGETEIQFDKIWGTQTKMITVWREGISNDYDLTVIFTEDPDTIRSITDFRFHKPDNPLIAANAVASIINTGDIGTITVQVYYSGEKPSNLIPSFITPGTANVGGIAQTSRLNGHDFSVPVEYRVVSRNGLYVRLYTVKIEFINLVSDAPRITSFRFNQNINSSLVQDTAAEISDGLIMIDANYSGTYAPNTLIPEFTAQGIVTVSGSVQISGSSAQFFNRQVKYTVTNPENPILKRDYWVQVRMTRDTSLDALINAFGFYPEDNPGLDDEHIGRIDQNTGKISVFAPVNSGISTRIMYPRFEAVGQVSVDGIIQSSGESPHVFDTPLTYTVTSANGKDSKTYTVIVKELQSTILVDHKAQGNNDGTSWQDAFTSLKDACEATALFPEDVPKEIWIAAGTYKPGANSEDYFRLTANTSYIGGFAGNETAKSQRNVAANEVIISGDLGGGRYANNLFGSFSGTTIQTVDGDLSFENLSLKNAKATLSGDRGNGAAICVILSDEAELNISRCNFNGFTASENGGAIYFSGGSVLIADSVIENVEANNGGAVYAYNNNALSVSSLSITNIRMTSAYSGAIYKNDGALTVDGLTLRDITGMGIVIDYAYTSKGNISLSGIEAEGISNRAVYYYYTLRVNNNYFPPNGGSFSLRNSKFDNTDGISALYDGSSLTPISVQIIDTEIYRSQGNYSSSLYVMGNVTINNVTINNAITGYDGYYRVPRMGGIMASGKDILITNSTIKNCRGSSYSAGIDIGSSDDSNVKISNVIIENCSIANTGDFFSSYFDRGGGIGILRGGTVEISNVTMNDVSAPYGGGISSMYVTKLTVFNTTFYGARAYNDGGGIYATGGLVVNNSRFENCYAGNEYGAIRGTGLEITGTEFINCDSRNDYKILQADISSFIRDCTFTDNRYRSAEDNTVRYAVSVFGNHGGNFEGCTFTNLKCYNTDINNGNNYLFSRYLDYPDQNGDGGSLYHNNPFNLNRTLTLKDCTFNFTTSGSYGSAGLMALNAAGRNYTFTTMSDFLLMDGCTINNTSNRQPLIWLHGNTTTGAFRFRNNNYYNGTRLSNEAAITGLGSNVIRRTGGAQVTMVP